MLKRRCDVRRMTSLHSLTLRTSGHNAALLLAHLGALRLHLSLEQLDLLHDLTISAPSMGPSFEMPLPHRLTSLCMENWGSPGDYRQLRLCDMLAGATRL